MDEKINKWTIYMYTFPNGKRYVGATTRSIIHRQGSLHSGWKHYKRCKLLYQAIQEFGVENIDQTILFEGLMENKVAAELESFFIEVYKTNANRYSDPSYGYNQSDGGEGTTKKVITEERRAQLRSQMAAFHAARLGSHPTEETRRRQSEAHMGQTRGLMPMDQRLKISKTNSVKPKEKPRKDTHGPRISVIMHDPLTGKTLRFESFKEAGFYYGVNGGTVSRWVNGTRKPPSGYIFMKEQDMPSNCDWEVQTVDIDRIGEGVIA